MKTKKEKPWEPGDGIYFLKNTEGHPKNWRIEVGCVDVNDEQGGPVQAHGYFFYTRTFLAGAPHAYHSEEDACNEINRALAVTAQAKANNARTFLGLGEGPCAADVADLVAMLSRACEIHATKISIEASSVAVALKAAYNMGVADTVKANKAERTPAK